MGYVPQYKNDIFVSYRRIANAGPEQWVDVFLQEIRRQLAESLGDVAIWRDKDDLHLGVPWRDEVRTAIEGAAIFLAIASRSYFGSTECRREFDHFLGKLKEGKGGQKRKIISIFKQPLPDEDLLPEITAFQNYSFFFLDPPNSKNYVELRPGTKGKPSTLFWDALSRVVQDLMFALEEIRGVSMKEARGKIFVSSVDPELQTERDRLKADLQQRGYHVLPNHEYIWNSVNRAQKMNEDLESAQLCVHLIARNSPDEGPSIAHMKDQLLQAKKRMKEKGRPAPIVWIKASDTTPPASQAFIDYIETELANEGLEILKGSLEDCKTQVLSALGSPPDETVTASAPLAQPVARIVRKIALLVEEGDLPALLPLKTLLVERFDRNPRTILFTGSSAKDEKRFIAAMESCDQCLVFWSAQSEDWVQDMLDNKVLDPVKMKDAIAVYVTGKETLEKRQFKSPYARALPAIENPNPSGLAAFLNAGYSPQ